jgi:hypothetical protein
MLPVVRRLLICLATLAQLWTAAAAHAQASVRRDGDAVVFDGQIHARSVAAFLQLVQDPAVTRLVITSQGGIVAAALDMAEAIHARGLDVEVPSACFSSCANYIVPAARNKLLGFAGAVAWHGNMSHVLYMQQAGQQNLDQALMVQARSLARRELAFFGRIGVDGFVCWFAKIPPFDVEDAFYLSVEDMGKFGIRNVTLRVATPARPDNAGLRLVAVGWAALEAARPTLQLTP